MRFGFVDRCIALAVVAFLPVVALASSFEITPPVQAELEKQTKALAVWAADQVVVAGRSNIVASVNLGVATANIAGATVVGVRSDGQALTNFYPVGVTTITWMASDSAGAHATCTQTITVERRY